MLVIVDSQSNATTVLKNGVPEKRGAFFGALKKMAAQNVNFVACGQVGFPHRLLLVANEAVPL